MSQVSICNQALGWIGANQITSIDDDSTEAVLCKANYEPIRDSVLEAHNWTFATVWAQLTEVVDPPYSVYPHSFQIPTDSLTVLFCGIDYDHPANWRREGQHIVTDEENCTIQYIYRVVDEAQFPPLFTQAFAARLAADLAIPITNSRSMQTDMYNLYMAKLKEAASRDNQQGRSRRIRSVWLNRAPGRGSVAGPTV